MTMKGALWYQGENNANSGIYMHCLVNRIIQQSDIKVFTNYQNNPTSYSLSVLVDTGCQLVH